MRRADIAGDPRFATNADRLANRDALTQVLDTAFSEQPVAHWMALLEGYVPVSPVYGLDQAMDNPWLETIGMRDTVDHPDRAGLHVLASPIKVDGQRLPNRAGPLLGADSAAILQELGYSDEEATALRSAGVV